jgi:ribosome-binding factor A
MPTRRQRRINELVLEELTLLVPGRFDDPRLANAKVTRVESTQDLSNVKVYVVSSDPDDSMEDVLEGLRHAEGVLRHELGGLGLRRLPHLVFAQDKAYESGERVLEILARMEESGEVSPIDPLAAANEPASQDEDRESPGTAVADEA